MNSTDLKFDDIMKDKTYTRAVLAQEVVALNEIIIEVGDRGFDWAESELKRLKMEKEVAEQTIVWHAKKMAGLI